MPSEKKMATYTGENGEHLMGVPATDLYETEWDRLTDAQRDDVAAASFYRVATARHAAAEKASTPASLVGDDAPKATAKQ